MSAYDWECSIVSSEQEDPDRITVIRPIQYEYTSPIDSGLFDKHFPNRYGRALTVNISADGMLVIMDHAPDVSQVIKVQVPIPLHKGAIPTLTEVAWTHSVPMSPHDLHFVGLKFIL